MNRKFGWCAATYAIRIEWIKISIPFHSISYEKGPPAKRSKFFDAKTSSSSLLARSGKDNSASRRKMPLTHVNQTMSSITDFEAVKSVRTHVKWWMWRKSMSSWRRVSLFAQAAKIRFVPFFPCSTKMKIDVFALSGGDTSTWSNQFQCG